MALTTIDIANVLEEIGPVILHGWIQKIYQPSAQTIVLEIRVPGRTLRLLLSSHPTRGRLHFLSRPLSNPPVPPPFCQFLRAHIQGARIDRVRQISYDRIVQLDLTTKNGPRILVCELTGRRADLFVLDADGLIIRTLSGDRTVLGRPYDRPGNVSKYVPAQTTARFSALPTGERFPLSSAIETYYQADEVSQAADEARNARARFLKKRLKKEQRRITAWQGDLAKAATYRTYARYGELLKANLASIKKGMERIAVIDYFDAAMPEITIPLDGTKSAQGNMDDYFRKHRKYVTAEREIRPRIEQTELTLDALRQELTAIERGTWVPTSSSESDRKLSVALKHKRHGTPPHGPFRRFISTDGLQIFVGRNARENDELTFGLAKSDDLWLHARGTPGSHVIVRLEKGREAPPETVKDAAMLALCYSDLKKSGKGEVIFTKRKWVKKAKGQAPGAVTVTREQSFYVGLDKTRLAALKARTE